MFLNINEIIPIYIHIQTRIYEYKFYILVRDDTRKDINAVFKLLMSNVYKRISKISFKMKPLIYIE